MIVNNSNILPQTEIEADLKLRHARLRKLMTEAGMEAMLIASNANIYYASGRFFRGYVLLTSEGVVKYFVIRPSGLQGDDVVYIRKPEQIADKCAEAGIKLGQNIGLELNELTYTDVKRLAACMASKEPLNASAVIMKARMVKTPYEIAQMRSDGLHQAQAYRHFPAAYRPDMTDLEFQIEMERILRLEGCLGYSRVAGSLMEINLGSVIAGNNADEPTPYDFSMGGAGTSLALPVGADGSIMHPGETVMVDMNGAFNGYQTDMTRTWRIGKVSELAEKAHECSRAILRKLEQEAVPGVAVAALYDMAMAIVEEYALKEYFMGHRQQVSFIGHGVGIQLNEPPVIMARSKDVLEANMTLAIEPKFVIPGTGAVGVENTYIVTPGGLENITIFPEDLLEL